MDDPAIPESRARFWRRWIAGPVRRQLTQGVSPKKIALSLAVASALALFPILGTTTTLCFAAGVALGLNQPIIQGVNALCTFAYFPLVVVFVRLGDRLAGMPPSPLDIRRMIDVATHHPADFPGLFGVTALHGILGWCVVAPVWIPLVYFASVPVLSSAAARLRPGP